MAGLALRDRTQTTRILILAHLQARPGATLSEAAKRPHERRLHHVIRVGARSEHSNRKPRTRIAMPMEQDAERLDFAAQYVFDQLGV